MFEFVKKPLLAFFKRCFPGAAQPSRPESGLTASEQRGFDRYPVSFPVLVSGNDADLAPFEEKSRLQDVSGSGAMFITQNPALYFPGQFLRLS
ncbi:MAG: PilZ domain-containing protein, partial [Desulfobacterales bacterium]